MLPDAGAHRPGREFSGERDKILARIRAARGDIDQRRYLRIGSGLADHRAAPGMRDQHGRAVLQRQRAAGRGDGIGKRRQRILHGGDLQPRRLQIAE